MIAETDSTNGGKLGLSPFSLLSAMLTAGITRTKDGVPGAQNSAAALPQELSGFLAGRISPKSGVSIGSGKPWRTDPRGHGGRFTG